jgi:hypothetical protein
VAFTRDYGVIAPHAITKTSAMPGTIPNANDQFQQPSRRLAGRYRHGQLSPAGNWKASRTTGPAVI